MRYSFVATGFVRQILSHFSSIKTLTQSRMVSLESTVMLSSGYRMPIVGLGTTFIDCAETVEKTLTAAIDIGYKHIDTAFSYNNEKFIGQVLKNIIDSGKVKREELFIVTKLPPNGMQPDAVEHFLKKSLTALDLKYVDLYLIHTPIATKRTDDENAYPFEEGLLLLDNDVDLVKTWHAMEVLVTKGLARSIGLSNFNSQQIQKIVNTAKTKPSVLQVECHAYLPQYDLFEFCRKLGITVTAYCPLGSPAFAEFARNVLGMKDYEKPKLLDDEKLKLIAEKYERTPAQILLRYLVQRGITVIPKSTNLDRLKQNMEIFDFSLGNDDMKALKSMDNGTRYMEQDFLPGLKEHPEYPFNIPF